MLIRAKRTSLHILFCKLRLYIEVIFKSNIDQDDNFEEKLKAYLRMKKYFKLQMQRGFEKLDKTPFTVQNVDFLASNCPNNTIRDIYLSVHTSPPFPKTNILHRNTTIHSHSSCGSRGGSEGFKAHPLAILSLLIF